MLIEFIKAYEEGFWDTEIIDVPDKVTNPPDKDIIPSHDPRWDTAIIAWCHDELAGQTQYRKVAYWGIYNCNPQSEKYENEI